MSDKPRREKPRKIVADPSPEAIRRDLERYRQLALELGASHAAIVPAAEVVVDERVRGKCLFPRCGSVGFSPNCPPYVMPVEEVRQLVSRFRHAILTRFTVPAEEEAGPEALAGKVFVASQVKNLEIVSEIESAAFYDGYYLATGFAGGACKGNLCPDVACAALQGQGCRFPARARPSMEGVGINAMLMAARQGWDVYPIGKSIIPEMIPFGNRLGIVFIC